MKFKNPTKYLVSFNAGIRLADGTTVPKWITVAPEEFFVSEKPVEIEMAMQQNEVNRAMNYLKGYLVVEKDDKKEEKEVSKKHK